MTTSLVFARLFFLLSLNTNPNPWHEIRNDDELAVWARDVPDSPVREVRAEATIAAPPQRVWDVLGDTPHYHEFMPYVTEARTWDATADHRYEYYRVQPPLASARDYTVKILLRRNDETGELIRHWVLANESGPPERPDTVRLSVCEGRWTLTPVGDNATRLTYWLYTDPAGSLPSWIANQAHRRSVPELIDAIRQRSVNPTWHR